MTSVPSSQPGRPVPDGIDLRLLAELAKAPAAGLPQVAWQAGLSQQEAAARLVTMNEAGLPLRLVAECDPAALREIIGRGPAGGRPQPGPPQQPAPYQPEQFQQPGHYPPPGQFQQPGQFQPAPFQQPPFEQPGQFQQSGQYVQPGQVPHPGQYQQPGYDADPPAAPIGRPVSPESVWGIPGSAAWTSRDTDRASGPAAGDGTAATPPAPAATETAAAAAAAAAVPARSTAAPVGSPQRAVGLSGEQLTVTVTEVIDPGNDALTAAGFRLDETERAVLVHTTVANAGPAPHDCMPDLYLFLDAADGSVLPKAPVAIAGRPAHRVGIAAGGSADGWTIFLIDAAVTLDGVRWCVRPDLTDRTLIWSLAAPAD